MVSTEQGMPACRFYPRGPLVKKTILCIVGARPNFMKIAPIIPALRNISIELNPYLVHTGQHYDAEMKDTFFDQLGIPEPDIDLGVGSGSHAVQTAEVMRCFEPVIDEYDPAAVLVVGDVNSTIACALVAVKKGIPVIHVEAGLRSGDRTMPEEINRVLTDQISDLLFTTEADALLNLKREGIDETRVHFVGNVMIDTLLSNQSRAVPPVDTIGTEYAHFATGERGYALVTSHRPANVDDPVVLKGLIETIVDVSKRIPVVFPIHPRTRAAIETAGLDGLLDRDSICCLKPLTYLNMLGLMASARMVLTDSGGIQEETTALGVPCITLRDSTERPITVDSGTNTIVGLDRDKIFAAVDLVLASGGKVGQVPEFWDGKAAIRIAEIIRDWLGLESEGQVA